MKNQHPLENCPLRTFGCITTTDTHPFRILDIDLDALDLFLSGYSSNDYTQFNQQQQQQQQQQQSPISCDYPHDQQFDHFEQRTHARAKALRFLKGLNIADVLLPDPQSCLTPSYTPSSPLLSDPSLQSFLVAEEAILSNTNEQHQILNSRARRVHACIHHAPASRHSLIAENSNINSGSSSSSNSSSNSNAGDGRRFYLVKDVTEMHGLAVAARSGVKLCGNLGQPQQPFSTRHHSNCREGGEEHELKYSIVPPNHHQQQQQQQQLKEKEEKGKVSISNRDSGIMLLDDDYTSWGITAAGSAVTSATPSSPSFSDPGLLILQVTRFGTIDHAFAISQSDQDKNNLTISHDHPLFLAQDRASIEAMTNGSIMAQVHPHDLAMLCKGLDQVCKALYTSFRARWRVHPAEMQSMEYEGEVEEEEAAVAAEEEEEEEEEEEAEEEVTKKTSDLVAMVERTSRIIEFQGEVFEEWVDSSAAVNNQTASPVGTHEEYVWAEVTGVLSNGSPILVVRPLTMSEAVEQEASNAVAAVSRNHDIYYDHYDPFVDAHSEDDEGYLEMEMDLDTTMNYLQDPIALVEWRTQKDQGWKRMDLGEGLYLSQCTVQGLSDLKESSSSDASSARLSKCHHHRHNGQHHSSPRPLLFIFSPMAALASWPALSSVVLDARKQWIHTIHLTQDQFRAWCEYLLDAALDQTIKSVSLGMTLLGYVQRYPTSPPPPYPYLFSESMESNQEQQHQKLQKRTVLDKNQGPVEPCPPKLSGLDRAGKVLEANCPALDGVVRQIGKSWIGQRIMEKSRLDQKLDVVADQVVDWWESKDSMAEALTTSIPLLNTLKAYTPYTPFSFLTSKSKKQ
ncbi:hypothetical protein BGX26_001668 [Mortierella sp. AD094]|nr:hypothetical protein BGX26_001668 [Mortierella sp. AD094]